VAASAVDFFCVMPLSPGFDMEEIGEWVATPTADAAIRSLIQQDKHLPTAGIHTNAGSTTKPEKPCPGLQLSGRA
jgi:hypothetical protein